MTGPSDTPSDYQQSVDQLFTLVGKLPPRPEPERPRGEPPPVIPSASADGEATEAPADPAAAEPTPAVAQPIPTASPGWAPLTDWQAEYQWLQEERKRLEAYTLSQFALIKQQREELLGRKSGIEEALALREQDQNRQLKLLADGTDALERRNRELAEREAALAVQMARLDSAQREFQELQQANVLLSKDNETQRLLAEQLRLQNAHLQEAVRAARSELSALEQAVQRRRQVVEEQKIELAASRRQLEARCAILEEAEETLRRRVAEIDQLEAQLRSELEQREHQLAQEHRELENARAGLRRELQRQPRAVGSHGPSASNRLDASALDSTPRD